MTAGEGSKSPFRVAPMTAILIVLSAMVGSALIVWISPPPSRPAATERNLGATHVIAAVDRPVPDFSLVDQQGNAVTRADLRGKTWIASFIFTRCHSICPTVSQTMAELQKRLPEDVMLVSFSVDPRHDTPEILSAYADRLGADPKRWKFLTGDRDQIYRISRDGFLLAVDENADPRSPSDDLVTHSGRIVVVDADGVARTTYNSLDPASIELVVRAVEKERESRP